MVVGLPHHEHQIHDQCFLAEMFVLIANVLFHRQDLDSR